MCRMKELPYKDSIHDALDFIPYSCHYCGYPIKFMAGAYELVAMCEMGSSEEQCYHETFEMADILKKLKINLKDTED